MKSSTTVEEIAGSVGTSAAVAVIAATAAATVAPAAAVLPVLFNSLASRRMQARINEAIAALEKDFASLHSDLEQMTDAQYKLVAEAVSAMMRATDEHKLAQLRLVAVNGVRERSLSMQKAQVLSRIIRDITQEELDLVLAAAPHKILAHPDYSQPQEKVGEEVRSFQSHGWYVLQNEPGVKLQLSGLLSLGLIVDANLMSYSWEIAPIAYSLIALLNG